MDSVINSMLWSISLLIRLPMFLGLPAVEANLEREYALLQAAMKKDFQKVGDVLGGLDGGFSDDLKTLANLGIQTAQFIDKVDQMKDKYGGSSGSIDEILDDPGLFLPTLGVI